MEAADRRFSLLAASSASPAPDAAEAPVPDAGDPSGEERLSAASQLAELLRAGAA